jgi:hypothetical protein
VKTQKQQDAEDKAKRIAQARRAAGLCTRDVWAGFNNRVACGLKFGHSGRCDPGW